MKRIEVITDEIVLPISKIETNLESGNTVLVQYSKNIYQKNELIKLNNICKKYGTNLWVRFYAHYSTHFDCSILNFIPNVKTLYIDSDKIINQSEISKLNYLVNFLMQVLYIENYDFLAYSNIQNIEKLDVGKTYAKKIDLKPLQNFRNLKSLIINGKIKNIDYIGTINDLESLYLHGSGKSENLNFINNLKKLKVLKLFNGGRQNINEIGTNSIEELRIDRVLGFETLDNLEKFPMLKELRIEDQVRLMSLDVSKNLELMDLQIKNCTSLTELNGINHLSKLKGIIVGKTSLDFDKFCKNGLPFSLEYLSFYQKNRIENKALNEKIIELGYKDYRH